MPRTSDSSAFFRPRKYRTKWLAGSLLASPRTHVQNCRCIHRNGSTNIHFIAYTRETASGEKNMPRPESQSGYKPGIPFHIWNTGHAGMGIANAPEARKICCIRLSDGDQHRAKLVERTVLQAELAQGRVFLHRGASHGQVAAVILSLVLYH